MNSVQCVIGTKENGVARYADKLLAGLKWVTEEVINCTNDKLW